MLLRHCEAVKSLESTYAWCQLIQQLNNVNRTYLATSFVRKLDFNIIQTLDFIDRQDLISIMTRLQRNLSGIDWTELH